MLKKKLCNLGITVLGAIALALSTSAVLSQSSPPGSTPTVRTIAAVQKSVHRPRIVYVDEYVHGQAVIAEVGSHIKYTFRHAVPRPLKSRLSFCTDGMFSIISDGSNGKPVEVKLLPGSEGGRGRVDILCENPNGTIACWSQVFPGGVQYIPKLFIK